MVFSSVTFLFLFLPIVLGLYHLVFFLPVTLGSRRRLWFRLSNLFLLVASLIFYSWGEHFRVWIFIGTTFLDYLTALLISGALRRRDYDTLTPRGHRTHFQRAVLAVSVCSNLAVLAYFKYLNFGVETYNSLTAALGATSLQVHGIKEVILPLGISFFTFHSMSYTIDVYRGHVRATRNFIDYACYVLMFPQLVAGPIVRFSYVADSLVERVVTARYFASGVARFALGLAKKVLIANTVATAADKVFALPANETNAQIAWLGVTAYTLQIYFDFSGYSDMAIGLGRMFGFELPRNFNFPYIASSVQEFWRRWHISLSTWFQDYLYIPMGGSHGSNARTYFNLITVFLLCGLWHGSKWTFIVWGLYHGIFLILERRPAFSAFIRNLGLLAHAYTLLVVMVGWLLFRADTFGQALSLIKTMAGLGAASSVTPMDSILTLDVFIALIAGVLFSTPVLHTTGRWLDRSTSASSPRPRAGFVTPVVAAARVMGVFALLVVCAMSLASGTYNPFIYFRF